MASFAVDDDAKGHLPLSYKPRNRVFEHPSLPLCQNCNTSDTAPFTFVVGADPQLGMTTGNESWTKELEYFERAIAHINAMDPRPTFFSICGDLVDMHEDIFPGDKDELKRIQARQYDDFMVYCNKLHPDIPLLCICGNHDVGNRPTAETIERFTQRFGDDYFSFWCNGCYMICLNTNIYSNCENVQEIFDAQEAWLEQQLIAATNANARRIYMFGHHPWFLVTETETKEDLMGKNHFLYRDGTPAFIYDSYFVIPLERRSKVMALCEKYKVAACFAGHYHQNMVGETTFGMKMITTAAICPWLIESTAKDMSNPMNATPGSGLRIVTVDDAVPGGLAHTYVTI